VPTLALTETGLALRLHTPTAVDNTSAPMMTTTMPAMFTAGPTWYVSTHFNPLSNFKQLTSSTVLRRPLLRSPRLETIRHLHRLCHDTDLREWPNQFRTTMRNLDTRWPNILRRGEGTQRDLQPWRRFQLPGFWGTAMVYCGYVRSPATKFRQQ
jgi:hypothetical protein